MSEQKTPEAKDLLKECEEMPALIQKKVGTLFAEQAKYFMAVENQYAQVKKMAEDLVKSYESQGSDSAGNPAILKMPVKETEKPGKEKLEEPKMVPIEEIVGENSIPYAMQWIKTTMEFIESMKRGFDSAKQNFNTSFEDVKKEGELATSHILLPTLDKLQHPELQKNPNFLSDLRNGGSERFMKTLEDASVMLNLTQAVLDEHIESLNGELERCALLNKVIDSSYKIISKLYGHTMENALKDLEDEGDTKAKSAKQMEIIQVFVAQKNHLETLRFHLQRMNALSFELLHLRIRQQNIELRGHTLHTVLLKNIFQK